MDPIPDNAIVVRGGRNLPEDIVRGFGVHPVGIMGVSVECGVGLTLEELCVLIPHGQIGVTTVAAVRAAGGDVVRTSGGSPHHATLTGIDAATASRLLTPTTMKPVSNKKL